MADTHPQHDAHLAYYTIEMLKNLKERIVYDDNEFYLIINNGGNKAKIIRTTIREIMRKL